MRSGNGFGRGFVAVMLAGVLGSSSTSEAYDVLDQEIEGRYFTRARATVGGFVQPRFRFVPRDEAAATEGEIGFSLARSRLEITGDLLAPPHRRWGFSISQKYSVELIPEPRLQDAYVDLKVGTEFQFRLGQFKAPIHRAILVSDANNLFPDRSQITRFVPNREMGFMFHGYWGDRQVQWQAAIFNGEGQNRVGNVNRKFMYVVRAVVAPFGSPGAKFEILNDWRPEGSEVWKPIFALGYSFHTNTDGPVGQQEVYFAHNVEGFFHFRPLTIMGEFFLRQSDWEVEELRDYNQVGWYVQAGYFLYGVPWASKHIALMGRVEQGDRFRPCLDNDSVGLGPCRLDDEVTVAGATDPGQASRRYAAGIGIYAGQPLFEFVQEMRVVISYTVKEELEDAPWNNDEFNVTANLTF